MSSLRKVSRPYRWPIENPRISNAKDYVNGKPVTKYRALADKDLDFTAEEIEKVIKGWNTGLHIVDIAESINKDQYGVCAWIIDLAGKGRLDFRPGGILGS